MSELTIKTNYRYRDLLCFEDLPEKVKSDFDYFKKDDGSSPRFVKYRGVYYDTFEHECVYKDSPFSSHKVKWQGYASDTYFSGTLIKYDKDYERVMVGRYFS